MNPKKNMKRTLTFTALILTLGLNAKAGEVYPPYYFHLKPSEKSVLYNKGRPFLETIAYGEDDGRKWEAKFVVRYRVCGSDSLKKYEVIDLNQRKVYRDNNLDGKFDEVDNFRDFKVDYKKVPGC
ncbi:hypothetical protein HYX19_00105 [Candidatus Woesearchaeota archaeon]|nr:hypothetical protein [Candidatus Woesearchaeota archaeon]